jgi:dipeptidyl aminopeptidase/acylaminoacyl peptidase
VEGSLVIEDIPPIPRRIVEGMERYRNTRSAAIADWSADGDGMLISTRFGETRQIHFVARPGGARRQLTFFDEPVRGAAVRPDPSRAGFLFLIDRGGSEDHQVYYFDRTTGASTRLTAGAAKHGSVVWSNRGDRWACYRIPEGGSDWEICVGEAARPGPLRVVLREEGAWSPVDWSPDDRRLLARRYISVNESRYAIVDLETGEWTPVHPTDGPIGYGAAAWSRDGKGIYLVSDEGSEFRRLRYYDLGTGRLTVLTPDIPWNVRGIELSPDGGRLAFTTNEGGIARLYLLDTRRGKIRPLPGVPEGWITGLRFDPDGERLAFTVNSPRTPGDVYAIDTGTGEVVRWTFSEVGGLDPGSFVVPELIHYETFDSIAGAPRRIPAFYYRPRRGDGPFPVLVQIHGGPEVQYVPQFSPTIQYLVAEMGIAVLAPNVRGSNGYGRSYLRLDDGYRREDTVRDIGRLLDWIETRPELDAARVGVYGGSYGGYMVLASMTHYDDRLRCAVDVVGISNFVTFLENTRGYRRDLRRAEYGDERDPAMRVFLERISPTTNAARITKPMFVVQGLNDPRVPAGEAEQIVAAIRANGGSVWYLLARDEGHGFRKKKNRDYFSHAMALFLEEYLLK